MTTQDLTPNTIDPTANHSPNLSPEKFYTVNEIFYSIQGEGKRFGTPNIFIRFAGCNLSCAITDPDSGFDCDTDFSGGTKYTAEGLVMAIKVILNSLDTSSLTISPIPIILTGGEPSLQIDSALIQKLRTVTDFIAIETNGTHELPDGIDWICVSPKSAPHTLRVKHKINELKYVHQLGQSIPKVSRLAEHYLLSPAFDPDGSLNRDTLQETMTLCMTNPRWELTLQFHKFFNIR